MIPTFVFTRRDGLFMCYCIYLVLTVRIGLGEIPKVFSWLGGRQGSCLKCFNAWRVEELGMHWTGTFVEVTCKA